MLTGMRAHGHGGPHHLRQPGVLRDDRLLRDRAGRPARRPSPTGRTTASRRTRACCEQELQGRSPAGGIEVKVMRKDGSLFDARMYVSPLIDPKGQQTGWMTSMTNITEAKRIRDQLSASHERFTTVLEGARRGGVGAARCSRASCCSPTARTGSGSAPTPKGHCAARRRRCRHCRRATDGDDAVDDFGGLPTQELTDAGSDSREVFVDSLAKWFDVRARYLQWTDGRLAQMLIATDITARRSAEAARRSQAEKAQVTSRLVTMGEMASSVAHELNQPLTAITNYCNGMVSRVRERRDRQGRPDRRAAEDRAPGRARRPDHPPHPRVREAQRAAAPAGAGARRSSTTRSNSPASSCAGATSRIQHLRRAAPADADGRPDPDRAGAAEPAEERRRGDRQRAAAAGAAQHRAARRAAPHAPRKAA